MRTEQSHTPTFLSSATQTLTSILIVLFIFEIGFRAYETFKPLWAEAEPMLISPDPYLQMKLTPNFTSAPGKRPAVHINSLGFRGPEINAEKAPGAFRIVCLGDSFAFGHDNDDDKTYPALLGNELRRRFPDRPIEVINGGVSSYVSFQMLTLLAEHVIDLKPDLILLLPGFNDLADASFPNWLPNFTFYLGWRGGDLPKINKTEGLIPVLMERSALVRRLAKTAHKIRKKLGRSSNNNESFLLAKHPDRIGSFNEAALQIFQLNLKSIAALCQGHGIELRLLTRPHFLSSDWDERKKRLMLRMVQSFSHMGYDDWTYAIKRYDEVTRSVAEGTKTPLIDLYERFGQDRYRLELYTDLAHLTDEGNLKVAQIVADEIASEFHE